MGEKRRHLGYCPEREWCPIILKYRRYCRTYLDEIRRRHECGDDWVGVVLPL